MSSGLFSLPPELLDQFLQNITSHSELWALIQAYPELAAYVRVINYSYPESRGEEDVSRTFVELFPNVEIVKPWITRYSPTLPATLQRFNLLSISVNMLQNLFEARDIFRLHLRVGDYERGGMIWDGPSRTLTELDYNGQNFEALVAARGIGVISEIRVGDHSSIYMYKEIPRIVYIYRGSPVSNEYFGREIIEVLLNRTSDIKEVAYTFLRPNVDAWIETANGVEKVWAKPIALVPKSSPTSIAIPMPFTASIRLLRLFPSLHRIGVLTKSSEEVEYLLSKYPTITFVLFWTGREEEPPKDSRIILASAGPSAGDDCIYPPPLKMEDRCKLSVDL